MTTRLELRTAVRRRLEDTGAVPLWDDATVNDLLGAAVAEYGVRVPWALATTVPVAAGATSVAVDAPGLARGRIARVLDPAGAVVPRQRDGPDDGADAGAGRGQAWRWWGGTLQFERPAAGGDWRIEYLGARALPGDDVTAVPVVAGDEEIVVLLAAALALRRRGIADAKRGIRSTVPAAGDALWATAERLLRRRRRGVVGGWVS